VRKANTALLEQGTQTPSPAPDLIPAETSTWNLHWDRYSKRGHFTSMLIHESPILQVTIFGTLQKNANVLNFKLLLPDVMIIVDEVMPK
jgi:hypothetical protein